MKIAGGKQKGMGWNPFKRSHGKHRMHDGTAAILDPYENGLYSSRSSDSSEAEAFSVTSLHNDDDESAIDIPPQQPDSNPNHQSTLDTRIVEVPIEIPNTSFDSIFASAVEVDLDDTGFFNDPFAQAALKQISIYPQSLRHQDEQDDQNDDFEDFDSAVFDPVLLSQKEGTPKSVATPRSCESPNDCIDNFLDAEKENEVLLEAKSPEKCEENPGLLEDECDGEDCETFSIENPSDFDNPSEEQENSDPPMTVLEESSPNQGPGLGVPGLNEQPAQAPTPRQRARNLILAKGRRSRPFRSRLKNVLTTKALTNLTDPENPMPPSACNTKSANNTESPRTPGNMTPRGTPKAATTPRSKQIWSKSKNATPRSSSKMEDDKAENPTDLPPTQKERENKEEGEGGGGEDDDEPNDHDEVELVLSNKNSVDDKEKDYSPISDELDEVQQTEKEQIGSPTTRPVLVSQTTSSSHKETLDNGLILVQSKSEIPATASKEDVQNMCATTQSFEIENVKLNGSDSFCHSPRVLNKALSAEEESLIGHNILKDIDDTNDDEVLVPSPPAPPTPPLLEQSLVQTSKDETQDQLLFLPPPPPPPPPPRSATPPRLVVIQPTGSNQGSEKESREENDALNDDEKECESFEQLEVFLEPLQEEQFYPAVNASESILDSKSRGSDLENNRVDVEDLKNSENPSFESALDKMSDIPHRVDSIDQIVSTSSESLQIQSDVSSDAGLCEGNAGEKPRSKLRKTMGKMNFLKGKKTRKSFPLPLHPSRSTDTTEDSGETPLVDWFDTQNSSKSTDASIGDTGRRRTWTQSKAAKEREQKGVLPSDSTGGSSGSVKVASTGKTQSSNLIYWSGSRDDFEVIAVAPSKQLATESKSWADSSTCEDSKEKAYKQETISKITKALKKANLNDHELHQSFSQNTGSTTSSEGILNATSRANRSQRTPWTHKATARGVRGVRASPRADKVLAMLGQPGIKGIKGRSPQVGDTIHASMMVSACSTLSDSSSGGSGSSYSYSDSDSDSEDSCASDSAILTASEFTTETSTAFLTSQYLLGSQLNSSDSDDDVFGDIDDDSAGDGRTSMFENTVNQQPPLLSCTPCRDPVNQPPKRKTRNVRKKRPVNNSHSFTDRSLSSASSAEYSSADSRSEIENDLEAHVQMAQEWYHKVKSAFLGNEDDNSIGQSPHDHANNVQCEYAGVLGRLKIDINQNK